MHSCNHKRRYRK